MKSNKWLPIIWTSLAAFVLLAFVTLLQEGPKYLGKDYFSTDEFNQSMDSFYQNIGPSLLNEFDVEEAKKRITVSESEIEEHRMYYGTLSDQLQSIQEQYEERIMEAKNSGNEQMKDALTKERDGKIADIQKNFDDDAYVEDKIRLQKSGLIDAYIANIDNYSTGLINWPIAYKFEDLETGEIYSSRAVDVPAAYKKTFNKENGLYNTGSIFTDVDISYESYESDMYHGDAAISMDYTDAHDLKGLIGDPIRSYTGTVLIPKSAMDEGSLGQSVSRFAKIKYAFYFVWIIGLLIGVYLVTKFRFRKEWVTENRFADRYRKLKIDTKVGFLIVSLWITFNILQTTTYSIQALLYYPDAYSFIQRVFNCGILVVAVGFTLFQLINFIERLKIQGTLEQDIEDSYANKAWHALQEMFLEKSIGIQTFILLIGFFLAGIGIVLVALDGFDGIFLVVYIPAVLFLGLPALYMLLRRSAYLTRIIIATEKMAQGRLHEEIKVVGKSPLAEHAKNLNNLREGVRISMTEQAKSERLKTELITNVSHDLRTPLTSIITYTDLLKAEDLSDEDRLKYVDILDRKSQRLKTLIEDLFEVSKMASGNMELNKQRVDLTQLLQQALAEHEEEISKTELDFRLSFPEDSLIVYVDGKRWWRVLDNLILNAIKYSMPGTRVYLTLQQVDERAQFVLKNVSEYELNENSDELFERFKRADTSRHTDGSGLGLAIAQSIVDMHDGKMDIEIDGDLFKVTVEIPLM